jgi:1-acyl-sn-glycerol-3-phosphate acyltransferase
MSTDTCANAPKPSLFIRLLKRSMSLFGTVIVSGSEHLEGAGGKIVVCNHVGYVDPLWVGYAALPRKLHQMAKQELFDNRISAWFVGSGGGFPVNRARPSTATIKHVVGLVEQGELVLIFPGGTRSDADAEAKRGAATFALRGKGQLIPAHYDGPRHFSLLHLLRRPVIRIRFGAALEMDAGMVANKASALLLTIRLDQAMKEMAAQAEDTHCGEANRPPHSD